MSETAILATASGGSGAWHVFVDDELECQIQTPKVVFSFKLHSVAILEEVKKFCRHEVKGVTHVGMFGKLNVHLFWDEEFPDTRAFVKVYAGDYLLEFTLVDDDLVRLEAATDQLLEDLRP